MTMYTDWQRRWPDAANELQQVLGIVTTVISSGDNDGKSEAWAQQQVRFKAAQQGAKAWRNNVGSMPGKCKACGVALPHIRWGLANDSPKLNKEIKSSDLILAIPRLIEPHHVGRTLAQFGSVECKRPGWQFKGTDEEEGQAAWLTLVSSLGGFAMFSTGDLEL